MKTVFVLALTVQILALCFIHFTDRVIYQAASDFNESVRVFESREGVRRMRFSDRATQSAYDTRNPDRIVLPYLQVQMDTFDYLDRSPQRVLVIGMGGGSMGTAIRSRFPDAWIDLVDIDPVVVDVARRFMGFRPDRKMHVHVQDGAAFLQEVEKPYDVILIDAFNGIDVPQALMTREFFAAVKRAMAPQGVVSSNLVTPDRSPAYMQIVERFSQVFGPGKIVTVPDAPYNRVAFFFS